jgi:tetratricopeptide (TPR) repeat protein
MTGQGRIVLVYRRAKCGAHPERVLAALDDRYREREVIDLALDGDGEGLYRIAHRLRPDDVLLTLADADWDITDPDADGALRISVDSADAGANLVITELTWEADVERLLDELDLRIHEPSSSTYDLGVAEEEEEEEEEDIDRLFDEAARMQESGRHQDAIALFQTIVASRTPPLAGRAAYAAARSYEKLRNPNFAVQAYREAISLGPQEAAAGAAYGLGRLLRRRGEFDEAAAAFAHAIEFGDASMRTRAEQLRDDALRKAGQV